MAVARWISERLVRLAPWLRRPRADVELTKELALHVDLETEANIEAGMSPAEARRRAKIALGNTPLIREDARAVWGWRWLDVVRREGRHVVRGLRRRPAVSLLVIVILALGIGATTTTFSVVRGVVLSPLPFHDPSRLVTVQVTVRELEDQFPRFAGNLRLFVAWHQCRVTCRDMAALRATSWALTGDGAPLAIRGAWVTDNLFDLLGITPALGRDFGATADGGDGEVILTYALWQQAFGGDPGVLGRVITLDGDRVEVVGVLPSSFWFPRFDTLYPLPVHVGTIQAFRPLRYTEEEASRPAEFDYPVIARLADGASVDQAASELTSLARTSYDGLPMTIVPIVRPLADQVVGPIRTSLWWLFAAVGAVFLIGCVNVEGLLTSQWLRRRHELAVRRAIGARAGHLVTHALGESAVLAAVGGMAGLLVAHLVLRLAVAAAPADIPRLNTVSIDGGVLVFATAVSALSALACGLVPAWRASRGDPLGVLSAASHTGRLDRSAQRVGDLLVGAEVALTALVLVVGALLLVSFGNVLAVDRGFTTDQVTAVDLNLPAHRYDSGERRTQFYDGLLARLEAAPGVEAAGITQRLPLEGVSSVNSMVPTGAFDPTVEVPTGNYRFVSPGYLRAVGMALIQGRGFSAHDRGQRVALVTASTADRLWPRTDPIGQAFHRGTPERPPQTVVGVVADARILGPETDPGLVAYLPYWEAPPGEVSLVVRSQRDTGPIVTTIREAVDAVDPLLPVSNVRTLDDVFRTSLSTRRFLMQVTVGFAGVGLLLVALGVIGAVSGGVERRRHEFAVRVALGATPLGVLQLILARGLRPVMIGLTAGLAASLVVGRFVAALLFGVTASDPPTLAAVALTVVGVAIAACLVPGLRAMRLSPAQALRAE